MCVCVCLCWEGGRGKIGNKNSLSKVKEYFHFFAVNNVKVDIMNKKLCLTVTFFVSFL